jgi:hypothetical protein
MAEVVPPEPDPPIGHDDAKREMKVVIPPYSGWSGQLASTASVTGLAGLLLFGMIRTPSSSGGIPLAMVVIALLLEYWLLYTVPATWYLGCTETVTVQDGVLMQRRTLFGIKRSAEYPLAHIHNLRVDVPDLSPRSVLEIPGRPAFPGPTALLQGYGAVAFDVGVETKRIARNVDYDGAQEIYEALGHLVS